MSGDISEEFIDKDVILFIIKQGLEDNGQYNKKIIDGIELFLREGETGNGILLDYESIVKLLINGYALSDKSAIVKINKGVTDAMALANKSIARRLKINDYLLFKQNQKNGVKNVNKITRLQFIWGSDAQNVFVFSGRTGQQQAVFNLTEVVAMLDNGQLTQTKEYDLPLLERSLYAILGDVHDNLAKESAIDNLTGLINQKEFIYILNEKLNIRHDKTPDCTLCLIDIDQFSLINDTCGYDAGDQYISEIAHEIIRNLSSDIICARYSTDAFILLLPKYSQEKASLLTESLRKVVNDFNFKWGDKAFTMSASIGQVSITERNDIGVFIKAVVTAATIAKETGRNRVHLIEYDALELYHRQELQIWATKIDQMVKHNRLDIRCQRIHPILSDPILQHYEMLLLVKDDNDTHMPPAEFIEAAELYNKMTEVDRWVIRYVFDWFSQHPEQLDVMGGIAINLSGQSLNDINFLPFILDVFEQYPTIPHDRICFEITETMAITNMSHANNIIHSIKELGCEFSLDDFGTGLSSYAYLKNLPVDYLKIDGVFIKDIANNPADKAMVKSINEIGHFLGMKTIAEYVENDEIVEVLKEIGVDYAQGYGIEKPILISDYMNVIESRKLSV
jgi:diguanylate cyclase (GGDEF)-like protein